MSEFLDGTGFISSTPKPEPEPEPIPEETKAEAIEVEEEEILVELPYTIEDFENLFKCVEKLEQMIRCVHEWEPTDTSGHCIECIKCGLTKTFG